MRLECGVCGRVNDQAHCEVIQLTKKELEALPEGTAERLVYCKPCWRTLADSATAPQVGRGFFLIQARALGVRNPEQWANRYFDLVNKYAKKPSS